MSQDQLLGGGKTCLNDVNTYPVVIKPCEHYIVEKGTLEHSIIRIHGKQDGSATVEKTSV